MMGRAFNFSFRGGTVMLVICAGLSLILFFLPANARIVVADRLGLVLTAPYWNLRNYGEDVLRVRDDNARLRARLSEIELMVAAGERMQRDAERMAGPALDPGFDGELIPCRVVMRQRGRRVTMMKIHALEAVDWHPWQPVVSQAGYLGRLRMIVSEREAWVELLPAPDFALGVEFARTGLLGVLRPRGDRFVVEMVGRDEDVQEGDRIITSGIAEVNDRNGEGFAGGTTPRGFPVGEVTASSSPSEQIFKEIVVRPAASFDDNETVFVVTAPDAGEQ